MEREESRGDDRIRLVSELRPARATVGDPVAWRLTAELPREAVPFPTLRAKAPPSLEWSEREPPGIRRRTGGRLWTWTLVVRGYDLGAIPLPSVALPFLQGTARDTLVFPPDTLFVDSLTRAATGEVPPRRGPLPTELRPIDWIVAGVAAVGIGLVALAVVRRLRARRERWPGAETAAAPDPPEAVLRRALTSLREVAGSLPPDRFHERLSMAIRAYVAAVTGVPALDRTTRELDRELRSRAGLSGAACDSLARLLRRADLAKFARWSESGEDPLRSIGDAELLIGGLGPPAANLPGSDSALEAPTPPPQPTGAARQRRR